MASFLKAPRRPEATGPVEVVTPAPPADRWADPLARAAADLTGASPRFATPPEPLAHGHGPWAFGFRLEPATTATDATGAAAGAPGAVDLTVRLATDRRDLDREVRALAANRDGGFAVPSVRGVVALDRPSDDDPASDEPGAGTGSTPHAAWGLVADAVTAVALPELIGFNLHHSNELLDGFAAHHDAIHRLPIDGLADGDLVPTISARDELDRIDRDRYPAEWAWLDEQVPAPGEVVLCHGGYQPLAVFGPPPEQWEAHGGPGSGLTVVNWGGAVLAEPEFDMAFTLVAFWSAPFFAPNRSERTAIKMIRNTLLNTYKQGYTSRRQVDPDRLRFWQAFHALRGLARLAGAYDAVGSPFAAGDRGAVPTDLGPELHRHFRQLTRVR